MPGVPVAEDQGSLRSLPGGGHAVPVAVLPPSALPRRRDELIAVAAQAFGGAPWHERPYEAVQVIDRMFGNLGRPDFTAVAALDGPHLAGFAYGHTDSRLAALDPQPQPDGGPSSAFEVVEFAVSPAYQGNGIGRGLHDALLAEAPSPRLLLTHPEATARQLYVKWGWIELGETPSSSGVPRVLMRHKA